MACEGLLVGGLERWRSACAWLVCALALLTLAGCGSGDSKKHAIQCNTADDCDASTLGVCDTVSCEDNRCEIGSQPDGHRCDDSDPLTGEDACVSGICAGVVKTCDDDLGPCLRAVHDPVTDECMVEPADDDTPCDDDDACTQLDSCQAGECVGSEPKTCAATDECHLDGECNPETGECSDVVAEDGAPCDDGQTCTTDDACQDGGCQGTAVSCDDGLGCSIDSCDEASGACVADMKACSCVVDADCDDGNACNGQETCGEADKLCQRGTPVVCAPSGDACLKSVCVPETGECSAEPVVDGTVCDDANACTSRDTCQAGACVGADAVVCTALSQCHVPGVCDKITGACSNPEKPKDSSCNDGNACTVTDTCQAGACVGSAQVSCAPLDQCHDAGVCATATGICSKPVKQNGVKCDDGDLCTSGDACQNGACTPASQVVCSAADSCHTAGACDAKTGKCSNPAKADGASCSDGLTCTTGDTCTGGKCAGSKAVCDDKVACTVDSCSEQLGGCIVDSSACACQTSADCDDGNPCNGVETCNLQTLQCQKGTAVVCTSLDDACNVGTCSAATGACVATPKANGTACDDADLCTAASSCQAGVCKGSSPVTCTASDQCHDAGACNSATGTCSNPVKQNGTSCNDGNACTKTDSCQSGVCTGSNAVVCSASDQCHTAGSCDAASGVCSNPAKKNGTACSDGNACTQTDTCQGGICAGASPVTCSASDQCHSAGTCDSATGTCSNPVKKDGSTCSDGNACTQVDTCLAGACTGASPVTCKASDQCHTAGSCDAATGACSNPAKKDGTTCNDANLCTQKDSCVAGVCTGANPVTCTASDQCHDAGTCDPTSGNCSSPAKPDNTPCGDGKACTSGDKCTKGVCGGVAISCDDKIACSVDSCVEPTGCNFDTSKCGCTKDADCLDADACNGVETCDLTTLTCKHGTAVSCTGLDDACNTGTCDSKTGACTAVPKSDGTGCDDGSACTKSDGCVAGKCVGAGLVKCAASDQCHAVGSCDPKTGACSNPTKTDGATCDDGDLCTRTDTCKAGTCTGGNAVTCSASDQCHLAGSCDPTSGACSNPVKVGSCDDGDKCTQTDTCQSGVCKGANPVVCSASDQCHDIGVCDAKTGSCSNPSKGDGTACDDSDKCTQSDSCQGGQCTGSKPVKCTALGQCYLAGSCDAQTGLCSNPFASAGTSCNDSNACTVNEVCDGKGACSGGSGLICSPPANTCQTNTCNTSLGCQLSSLPNGTACDDASECTLVDVCSKGICVGGSRRANAAGDWADDPGAPVVPGVPAPSSTGPTSVDVFTDKSENVHAVGTYVGTIAFNDKDVSPPAKTRALGTGQETGIYWARYSEAGVVLAADNLGGVAKGGTLSVAHAAGHPDGSFTLVGSIFGSGMFGLNGKTVPLDASKGPYVYVVHYLANGAYSWSAYFVPQSQSSFTVDSVAAFDDGAVIVIGANVGSMVFNDAGGKAFASTDKAGIWAARLSAAGVGQWAGTVVVRGGTAAAQAVTTHEDGGASLTGGFTVSAGLGPNGEIPVSTGVGEKGRDIWFEKLDKSGKLLWGGRVGGANPDVPGDVARVKGGGTLLLANTSGSTPNASDAKNTQQLHATPAALQAHVLSIDADGVIQSDGLIANPETGSTRGWQLKLDAGGFYSVGGMFATGTSFWSKVGFGSGSPQVAADFSIASAQRQPGPATLFLARVNESSIFDWAVQAGGDNSGMATGSWDIVLTAHPSHSATIAGIFNQTRTFGDQVTESLQSWLNADGSPSTLGSPFVVHLNSQAEYDYCP
jgi:hypothetical protein